MHDVSRANHAGLANHYGVRKTFPSRELTQSQRPYSPVCRWTSRLRTLDAPKVHHRLGTPNRCHDGVAVQSLTDVAHLPFGSRAQVDLRHVDFQLLYIDGLSMV
jgi:hypothetical protein